MMKQNIKNINLSYSEIKNKLYQYYRIDQLKEIPEMIPQTLNQIN